MTEKFKRPFKKRHSNVYHQPSNRVNKFLAQAIEARSVDREKTAHVNRISLNFRESEKEKSYHQDFDYGFTMSMVTSLTLLILSAGLQVGFTRLLKNFVSMKIFAGFSTSTHINFALVVPNRIHMDLCHFNAHPGCSSEMDLLGRCTKFFTSPRNNCLHHHFTLLSGADECRKLSVVSLFRFISQSIFIILSHSLHA